jgi:hypothetical protein
MALGAWKSGQMMRRCYAAVTDQTLRAAAEAVSGQEPVPTRRRGGQNARGIDPTSPRRNIAGSLAIGEASVAGGHGHLAAAGTARARRLTRAIAPTLRTPSSRSARTCSPEAPAPPCAGPGHLAGPLATRYRAAAPTEGARPRGRRRDGVRRRGARNVASISTCRRGRSTIVHADFSRSGTRA